MRVFSVRNDVNRYRYFLTTRDEDAACLVMDGTSLRAHWAPPPVYVYRPRHRAGDFYQFYAGSLIMNPRASRLLTPHLSAAGELLPLPYRGQEYTLFNPLVIGGYLDTERSVAGAGYFRRHVFAPDKLATIPSALFKIAQEPRGDLLFVEGIDAAAHEFRTIVEVARLEGLLFTELWCHE